MYKPTFFFKLTSCTLNSSQKLSERSNSSQIFKPSIMLKINFLAWSSVALHSDFQIKLKKVSIW